MGLEFKRSIKGHMSFYSPSLWPWYPHSSTWAPGPLAQVTDFHLGVTVWGQKSRGDTFPFTNRLLFITCLLVLHLLQVPPGRLLKMARHTAFFPLFLFTTHSSHLCSLNIKSVLIIPHVYSLYLSFCSLSFCFVLHLDKRLQIKLKPHSGAVDKTTRPHKKQNVQNVV